MCLAIPGQIVELNESQALVDFQGNRLKVCTTLTPGAAVNGWVLVHAGFAIAIIDEADARETWSYLNELNEIKGIAASGDVEPANDRNSAE